MRIFAQAVAATVVSFIATMANSQEVQCVPREAGVANLQEHHGERRILGASPHGENMLGVRLEWWGNPRTGEWTFTGTYPDGRMCKFGNGNNLELGDPADLPPKGDET